ncbi:MAG: hypothetical protein KatS3mg097_183 [Candidatus Parcubacteria bacterium]|nr:MAG: hypothetical protein KatS3mg097_183 [Candidatus Parcubacteria bacterium]
MSKEQESSARQFGKHLTVDAYGVDAESLFSFDKVFEFLDFLPSKINMKKLTIPYVVKVNHRLKKESGVSGFVMIYTSHISCHTWPFKNYLSIDVYSCKDFNEKNVINLIKKFWLPQTIKTQLIYRG